MAWADVHRGEATGTMCSEDGVVTTKPAAPETKAVSILRKRDASRINNGFAIASATLLAAQITFREPFSTSQFIIIPPDYIIYRSLGAKGGGHT